jgi:hypothetical protein
MGLIAGTYSASPKLGGQLGISMDFPNTFGSLVHRAGAK